MFVDRNTMPTDYFVQMNTQSSQSESLNTFYRLKNPSKTDNCFVLLSEVICYYMFIDKQKK